MFLLALYMIRAFENSTMSVKFNKFNLMDRGVV